MRSCSGRVGLVRVLCTAAVVAASGVAMASETRILTLRGVGGITDETDVYTFPGALPLYSVALIELGTAADTDVYGGALKKLGVNSAGVVVSRDDSVMTND